MDSVRPQLLRFVSSTAREQSAHPADRIQHPSRNRPWCSNYALVKSSVLALSPTMVVLPGASRFCRGLFAALELGSSNRGQSRTGNRNPSFRVELFQLLRDSVAVLQLPHDLREHRRHHLSLSSECEIAA